MKNIACAFLLVAVVFLSACSGNGHKVYQANLPAFDLKAFFSGNAVAVGTVSDRGGNVTRRFKAKAVSEWLEDRQAIKVTETWYWDDGEIEPRNWIWERKDNGQWLGYEDDLKGVGRGQVIGSTLHWDYVMYANTERYGRVPVRADDIMHLIDDNHIINLVDMYVWGFYVGQVVLHIEKVDNFDQFDPAFEGVVFDTSAIDP